MISLSVDLGARAYGVHVGDGLLPDIDGLFARAGCADASAFALVADRAVTPALRTAAQAIARLGVPVHEVLLDVEERLKSPAGLDKLYEQFFDARLDRRSVVVAIGGGVIGDLTGYAAATFLRGVRWVGVPTTLLAAVDSSIGGKTGINHPRGKNLIGAIYQPSLVVVDPELFATLPARERVSGFGEMLKYGLALDPALWTSLIASGPDAVSTAAIARSIELKAQIVARDERDADGIREVLNFGHTVGHAIETVTDYARYRHGEAVVLGMRAALRLSVARGHFSATDMAGVDAILAAIALPQAAPFDLDAIAAATLYDKKRGANGRTRFVLLRALGDTVLDDGVDAATLREAIAFLPHDAVA
jgi:3-dehydroquinate synthase